MENNTPQEIWNIIKESKNPICILDGREDFDAIGSALALQEVLKDNLNILLDLYFHSGITESRKKHVDVSTIKQGVDLLSIDFSNYDLLIVTDNNDPSHLSPFMDFKIPDGLTTIQIDHHASEEPYGDYSYVDPKASSACLLVYKILKANNLNINDKAGKALLLGLLTDSGFLRYKNVSSDDFLMVSDLMVLGIDYFQIVYDLTFNETLDTMKYKKILYSNLIAPKDKNYAYSTVTRKELLDNGVDLNKVFLVPSDLIKTLDSVDFVFTIREDVDIDSKYNVSFRSHKPDFTVSDMAKALNGGGHEIAAGGEVVGVNNVLEALKKVEEVIERYH